MITDLNDISIGMYDIAGFRSMKFHIYVLHMQCNGDAMARYPRVLISAKLAMEAEDNGRGGERERERERERE